MLEVLHVKLKLSMLCSRAGRSLARVVVQAQQLGFSSQSGSSSSELAAFWQGLLQPPPQPKPGDGSSKGSEANVDAAKARQLLSDHFRLFKGGTLPGGTLPEDVRALYLRRDSCACLQGAHASTNCVHTNPPHCRFIRA